MNKIKKYLSFLPFAISIGSLIIYMFYTIRIRFARRVIVTPELSDTLKTYLIIALISLLIGLLIIFINKVYTLFKGDSSTIKDKKVDIKEETIVPRDDVIKVKFTDSSIKNDKIVGDLSDTNQDAELHIDDKKDYNFRLDGVSCPECRGIISKDAAICPHCGILFDNEVLRVLDKMIIKEPKKKKVRKSIIIANILLIIVFTFLIFLVSNMLINKSNQNKQNINAIVINEENIK